VATAIRSSDELTGEVYAYTDPRRMAVRLFDNYFAFAIAERESANYLGSRGYKTDRSAGSSSVGCFARGIRRRLCRCGIADS